MNEFSTLYVLCLLSTALRLSAIDRRSRLLATITDSEDSATSPLGSVGDVLERIFGISISESVRP